MLIKASIQLVVVVVCHWHWCQNHWSPYWWWEHNMIRGRPGKGGGEGGGKSEQESFFLRYVSYNWLILERMPRCEAESSESLAWLCRLAVPVQYNTRAASQQPGWHCESVQWGLSTLSPHQHSAHRYRTLGYPTITPQIFGVFICVAILYHKASHWAKIVPRLLYAVAW